VHSWLHAGVDLVLTDPGPRTDAGLLLLLLLLLSPDTGRPSAPVRQIAVVAQPSPAVDVGSGVVSGTTVRALVLGRFSQEKN